MKIYVPKGTKEAYEKAIKNNFPAEWERNVEVVECD